MSENSMDENINSTGSLLNVTFCVDLKYNEEAHRNVIIETIENLANDVTIISADNEAIETNKYLLSLKSPTLFQLFSASASNSHFLFLPDCSSSSIKSVISPPSTSFEYNTDQMKEHIETFKILDIDSTLYDTIQKDLTHDLAVAENTVCEVVEQPTTSTGAKESNSIPLVCPVTETYKDIDEIIDEFDMEHEDDVTENFSSVRTGNNENLKIQENKAKSNKESQPEHEEDIGCLLYTSPSPRD